MQSAGLDSGSGVGSPSKEAADGTARDPLVVLLVMVIMIIVPTRL